MTEELNSLAKALDVVLETNKTGIASASNIKSLWESLSYNGSNDLAWILRGGTGVSYAEILRDVCEKQKVKSILDGDDEAAILGNEQLLIEKLFTDIWDKMSEEERAILINEMDLNVGAMPLHGMALPAILAAAKLGGFATYQLTLIVANTVARALFGSGLAFATNTALMRGLGAFLGPIGWFASGAWMIIDIAGPAYRKTLPSVVIVAALRQQQKQREIIGIIGPGSVGKDSLLKYVFEIDTPNIHPTPGTTKDVTVYNTKNNLLRVMNFPGFRDLRPDVNVGIDEMIQSCSLFLYLLNGNEIPKSDDLEEYKKISSQWGKDGRVPVIHILNKWDKADEDEKEIILSETAKRLCIRKEEIIVSCMKPERNKRLHQESVAVIRKRINESAQCRGKAQVFSIGTLNK